VRGEIGMVRQGAGCKRDEIVEVDPIALDERACVRRGRLVRAPAHAATRPLLARNRAQEPLRLAAGKIECRGD
jgi:hypothetical protein